MKGALLDDTTRPDLAVVIPAYRAEAFIARAIRSVIEQPGIDLEIIVVVDGIFDRTAEIASGFRRTRVLVNETNQGAPAARNRGLAQARAAFVMFLDADDWVEGELLHGLVESLATEEADVAFGPLAIVSCDGLRMEAGNPGNCVGDAGYLEPAIHGAFVAPCTTMWRAAFLRANGGWRHGLRRYQDYELVLRSLILGARPTVSNRGFGVFFQHSSQNRVTANFTRDASIDRLTVLRSAVALTKERNLWSEALSDAFERAVYRLVRDFARNADDDIFAETLQLWHELGGSEHHGSLVHRLSARALGLRRKERLATAIARLRRRVVGMMSASGAFGAR